MARARRHRRPPIPPSPTTDGEEEEEEEGDDDDDDDDRSLPADRRSVSTDGDVADDEAGQTPLTGTDASCSGPGGTESSAAASWRSPAGSRGPASELGAAPSTYVNVAPLPIFRGAPGECPVSHLRRFTWVCRANNASSADAMARIFPVTLDDGAALWYELEVEPRPGTPWEAVRSSFLRAYCGPESAEQSRSELMAMKQGYGEPVRAYYLRMHWLLRKWPGHGIPDAMLRGIFVDGLGDDCQDWIAPQRPGSLGEAFRLAASWEQAQSVRTSRRQRPAAAAGPDPPSPGGTAAKCGFCDGPHAEGCCEVRRRMRELWLRSRDRSQAKAAGPSSPGGEPRTPGQGNLRSLSLSTSMVRREAEDGQEAAGQLGFRRPQCQCSMHQCWKKLDRSSSVRAEENPPPTAE